MAGWASEESGSDTDLSQGICTQDRTRTRYEIKWRWLFKPALTIRTAQLLCHLTHPLPATPPPPLCTLPPPSLATWFNPPPSPGLRWRQAGAG
jgi:hypothetical protein